jgi:hypothetical protein
MSHQRRCTRIRFQPAQLIRGQGNCCSFKANAEHEPRSPGDMTSEDAESVLALFVDSLMQP